MRRSAGYARATLPVRGYTFAEVLVALAILGFVAASLYGAFVAGFCAIQTMRENLRATQVMMQKMEAIRLFTWSQINDTNNYLKPMFVERYDPQDPSKNNRGASYTGYMQARVPNPGVLPEAYRTNMRTITVTVYWTNYNGSKPIVHKREMETRVARNGMQNYIWGAL
jgi:prepilin-type N-terminal cleavage/methylation domain-containing protein